MDGADRRRWLAWLLALGLVAVAVAYGGWRWAARARQPRLVDWSPAAGAVLEPSEAALTLRLSAPAEAAVVQQAVHFDPPLPGRWQADAQGQVWRFVPPAEGWPRGRPLRVQVGPPLAEPAVDRTFRVRPTWVAYLWPQAAPAQVYALDPAQGVDAGQRALTRAPRGVVAFAVAAEDGGLVFSAVNAQGGADLWFGPWSDPAAARVWVACGPDWCTDPQVGPDGWVAFVREPRQGPARVEVASLRREAHLEPPAQGATRGPRWSLTGVLAYYDTAAAAYRLWTPAEGSVGRVPNETGEHAAWGAAGRVFYHVELLEVPPTEPDIPDPRLSAHLLAYDRTTRRTTDLTAAWHWEDATPAADPTGRYLAFGRKNLRPEAWTPGRQLWLYDLTRAAAYPLTDAAAYNHLDFAWAPDGRTLAYVRTHQLDLSAAPELWLYDLGSRRHTLLLEGAYAPQWIP